MADTNFVLSGNPVKLIDQGDSTYAFAAELTAGTAIAGKVGIDQTTDGTTNKTQAHLNVAGAVVTVANPVPIKGRFRQSAYVIPTFDLLAWSGFTNQPADDGVEIVSSSASDVGKCTIFGTTHAGGAFAYETVTLTGTNVKATTKVDWGNIYGVFLGDVDGQNITPAVGTITFREASADAAITTLTAAKISKGMIALNFGGKNILLNTLTGNVYSRTAGVVTTANGFLMLPDYSTDEYVSGHLYLISDTSGGTAQIKVYAD